MKSTLDPTTTAEQKMGIFNKALRHVIKFSHDDLKRMIAEEKIANAGKKKRGPKPKASDHVFENTV